MIILTILNVILLYLLIVILRSIAVSLEGIYFYLTDEDDYEWEDLHDYVYESECEEEMEYVAWMEKIDSYKNNLTGEEFN